MRSVCATALFCVLAACGGPVPPWKETPAVPLDLKVAVSADKVALLQPVSVDLDLFAAAGVEAEFDPKVDDKDFLVDSTTKAETAFGTGRWRRTTLVLRPRRGPGEIVLPSFVAKSKDGQTASTGERKITVESLLAGQTAAIEAPGEPFPSPLHLWWWGAIAAGLIGCGAVAFYALGRRRRLHPHAGGIEVPPHVKALRALQRLRGSPRTTAAQVDAFYVEVSSVLRVYLEERFGLRAPELTTEEFLLGLESGDQLARGHRGELERFLMQCDLVKFAAVVPGENEHLATFALAQAFVESTRADRADRLDSNRAEVAP
jgi:hypothetical protein